MVVYKNILAGDIRLRQNIKFNSVVNRAAGRARFRPQVTQLELSDACSRLGENKTPGQDGIPNKALKVALEIRPDTFAGTFVACTLKGIFRASLKSKTGFVTKIKQATKRTIFITPHLLVECASLITVWFISLKIVVAFRRARSTVDKINVIVKLRKML